MGNAMRHWVVLVLAFSLLSIIGCSGQKDQPTPSNTTQPTDTQKPTPTPAVEKKTAATGTITAEPNPVKVCDGSGTGKTTLSWTAKDTYMVEVRIGAPNGGLFAHVGPVGTKTTDKWVSNGMVIYLQDVSGGKPPTPEYTIATVTVNVTTEGCP